MRYPILNQQNAKRIIDARIADQDIDCGDLIQYRGGVLATMLETPASSTGREESLSYSVPDRYLMMWIHVFVSSMYRIRRNSSLQRAHHRSGRENPQSIVCRDPGILSRSSAPA